MQQGRTSGRDSDGGIQGQSFWPSGQGSIWSPTAGGMRRPHEMKLLDGVFLRRLQTETQGVLPIWAFGFVEGRACRDAMLGVCVAPCLVCAMHVGVWRHAFGVWCHAAMHVGVWRHVGGRGAGLWRLRSSVNLNRHRPRDRIRLSEKSLEPIFIDASMDPTHHLSMVLCAGSC